MKDFFTQFLDQIRSMPVSRKIVYGAVVFFIAAGCVSVFLWANKAEYKKVYSNLSTEDTIAIVERLKKEKIPYQLNRDETIISVPAEQIHKARLMLAAEGLPRGGGVGFEIFDKTDFGTTEFVQHLNYQRALQGELARTIKEIDQVKDARVLIVMPKDSVFVEDTKPPSASVFLKLKEKLGPDKVQAVIHLVASAIEGLTPDLVTVIDANGKVLSSGMPDDESTEYNSQLTYKHDYEKNMAGRIQTMLEGIVGVGKAIVRVTADMDFSQVDVNEEIYDPDAQVVRSRQTIADTIEKKNDTENKISSVNPIGKTNGAGGRSEKKQHQDDTINYEISKTIRITQRPVGTVQRLSVAAVLDGTYSWQKVEGGRKKVYVPRTQEDINQFTTIVKQTMGYSADREDQISVESIPFSAGNVWGDGGSEGQFESDRFDWRKIRDDYGRAFANIFLIALIFIFVVRPLIKNFKEANLTDDSEDDLLSGSEMDKISYDDSGQPILPKPKVTTIQDKAILLAREDINKSANILKGWLSEGAE